MQVGAELVFPSVVAVVDLPAVGVVFDVVAFLFAL
jgi:hypothetical protein